MKKVRRKSGTEVKVERAKGQKRNYAGKKGFEDS